MKIIVLKFGGTSVGSIQRIKKVSKIIKSYSKKYRVIVLSSAMSGTTNKLINMSKKISENFPDNEYDALVSAGEQISCSLLAGHLASNGLNSRSWMAWQIPIVTEGKHKYSRIKHINKTKILKFLKSGGIPIIAGFQGVDKNSNITTIGRGGSDSSAIMVAKFFKADRCVIYTDVEGVYTTDPNKLNSAKKIKNISYEEMLEMASLGSKVMQPDSIQDARLNRINIEAAIPGLSLTPNKVTFASLSVEEIPVIILLLIIFFLFVINVPDLFINDDFTSIFILFNLASCIESGCITFDPNEAISNISS